MRFSILVAGAFAAIASAQTTTPAQAATQTYALDPAQSSIYSCLDKCDAGDVDCQSKCISVPAPNEKQANDTVNCVADCPQGDGSEAQTKKYEECTQACIKKHYFDSTEGSTPNNGGSGSSAAAGGSQTGTAAVASKTGALASASHAASSAASALASAAASASAAVTSTTPNAAPAVAVGSAALLGLVAFVFAL